jgi:hypothetical protein
MNNKYYCLILPNSKVELEAVEEIFREQEAYDKKLENSTIRSGHVFTKKNNKNLPKVLLEKIISSNFFKKLKLDKLNSIYLKNLLINDFTILLSTNKEFITWITLKLVEIETSKNLSKNDLTNFEGYNTEISL